MKGSVLTFLKGMAIGVANIIPGVSGGTMAVVLGVYEDLVTSISRILTDAPRRKQYFFFLLKIGAGAGAALFLLSGVIDAALTHYEKQTILFFMGLILGSFPSVLSLHGREKISLVHILALAAGVLAVLLLGGGNVEKSAADCAGVPLIVIFGALFLAGGAMIIPGVSGSFVLLLLGYYAYMIRAVHDLDIKVLAAGAAGAGAGIVVFSFVMSFLLSRFKAVTHFFIFGLVGASFLVLYKGMPSGSAAAAAGAALFASGAALAFFFSGDKAEKKQG